MSKVSINESTLTAIGDAIRAKTGKSDLIAPGAMPTEIEGIETGGGGAEVEPIVFTGDCSYACAGELSSKFINLYKDKVSTKDVSIMTYMFRNYANETIPFDINIWIRTSSEYVDLSYGFAMAYGLTELPKLENATMDTITSLFSHCYNLRTIPEGYSDTWDFDRMHTYAYCGIANVFSNCYSLRKISDSLLKEMWGIGTSGTYVPYYNGWLNCYSLDELIRVPIHQGALTSNRCNSTIDNCARLKRFTFATNEDGTPKTAKWKSQTLDFTSVGSLSTPIIYILSYNSGITADKEVVDDATYQALKNDPDWFTLNVAYSRYNHDSAVETINSLPDCSATGTNTIKFKGEAGSATDGGACNTLTEEEIAVATAKGWTVTFV